MKKRRLKHKSRAMRRDSLGFLGSPSMAAQERERRIVIRLLGLPPEDRTSRGSRYAMTTGEFIRELKKDRVDALEKSLRRLGKP